MPNGNNDAAAFQVPADDSVKIATFNINGMSARLAALLQWLEETRPDVACLQELKTPQEHFPVAELDRAGYGAVWHGQSAWNGVAILARGAIPRETHRGLPGDPDDVHSRYIEAEVRGIMIGCLYLPNGNPVPGPKFDYKLRWFDRLDRHARKLLSQGGPVVLAGDYNVIPEDIDVYAPERWREDALFRTEVREAYERLLGQGWTDAVRHLHPDEKIYTFWKYFRNAFSRNSGLRIDHFLVNATLKNRLVASGVDLEVRARFKPSDHAPVWIEVANRR